MAATAILDLQKFPQNFNGWSAVRPICVSVPIFVKIDRTVAEIWQLTFFFQNGGRPPSIGTTRDDHLVVSIVMPNLVKIDGVVSTTWNFQYFAFLAWKRLFTPPKWGFGCISPPKWGAMSMKPPPKRHVLARVSVVWAVKSENPLMGLTCRLVHKIRYK